MEGIDFLKSLYHAASEDWITYLWSRDNEKRNKRTNLFKISELESMMKVAERLNVEKGRQISYSIGLIDHHLDTYQRAKDIDIKGIPCLWCDIDIANEVHGQNQKLAATIQDAINFLPMELPASIIVNSGYGIHSYWIFDEILEIRDEADRSRARGLLEKLQGIIRYRAGDCYIDKTADLSRMLRLPGTYNWKGGIKKDAPICRVIETSGKIYKVEEIETILYDLLREYNPVSKNPREISSKQREYLANRENSTSKFEKSQEKSLKLFENCKFCQHCLENAMNLTHDEFKYFFPTLVRASDGDQVALDICRTRFAEKFNLATSQLQIASFKKMTPVNCETIATIYSECREIDCPVKLAGKKSPVAILNSKPVQKTLETGTVGDIFSHAPECIRDLKIPYEFELQRTRVVDLRGKNPRPILNTPAVISREYYANDTELPEFYEIMYLYRGKWMKCHVKPSEISDSRELVKKLSEKGIHVTTRQSGAAAEYFNTFLEMNEEAIERMRGYSKLGWHGRDFILPTLNDGSYVIYENASMSEIRRHGARQISIDLLKRVNKYPYARLLVDANLAAPLLELIGCRNFTLDLICPSHQGKTTALLFANSLWGSQKWMANFNSTTNAAEEFSASRNSLPTNINEWQLTDSRYRDEKSNQVIHRHSEGVGKARLNRDGSSKPTKSWHGIQIVTSEEPLTSESSFQGVKTRCWEVSPDTVLGDRKDGQIMVNFQLCKDIQELTKYNYGHLGPEFIQNLLKEFENDPEFSRLREENRTFFDIIVEERKWQINTSHADFLAAIACANFRVNLWFLGMTEEDAWEATLKMIGRFLNEFKTENSMTDAERAKNGIIDWYEQNKFHFIQYAPQFESNGQVDGINHEPRISIVRDPIHGFWTSEMLYFYPQSLRRALKELNFSDRKIMNEWGQQGYLDGVDGKHRVRRRDGNGDVHWGIGLKFITPQQNSDETDENEAMEV